MLLRFLNEIIACFHFALILCFGAERYVLLYMLHLHINLFIYPVHKETQSIRLIKYIQRHTANTTHNPLQSVYIYIFFLLKS